MFVNQLLTLLVCLGVSKAINNVNTIIAPALVGKELDLKNQAAVDKILLDLDKTENKCENLVFLSVTYIRVVKMGCLCNIAGWCC